MNNTKAIYGRDLYKFEYEDEYGNDVRYTPRYDAQCEALAYVLYSRYFDGKMPVGTYANVIAALEKMICDCELAKDTDLLDYLYDDLRDYHKYDAFNQ